MKSVPGNLVILVLIVELVLLSIQAEQITATIGFVLAGLLTTAFIMSTWKVK